MSGKSSLNGKTAVVTGASRGIGLALAQALASHDCKVVLVGRALAALQFAARQLGTHAQVTALPCDVSNLDQVQELFATVKQRFSSIDILINNAGIAHALAPITELSVQTWKQVIDVNLTGAFLCARAALPLMGPGGTIVNNLSVAALQPFSGMSAYNASKAGALGFTNVLREELRERGIRVLALIPGATDTDIWGQFWPEAPKEKMLAPATVAEAVLQALLLPPEATIEEIRLGPTVGVL